MTAIVAGGGTHKGCGGDPRIALTWIVNELSALVTPTRAGEVVTTGTCMTPISVEPGDELRGDYGAFGSLSVTFIG